MVWEVAWLNLDTHTPWKIEAEELCLFLSFHVIIIELWALSVHIWDVEFIKTTLSIIVVRSDHLQTRRRPGLEM